MKTAKATFIVLASVSAAMLVQTSYTIGAPAISEEGTNIVLSHQMHLAHLKAEASRDVVNIDGP